MLTADVPRFQSLKTPATKGSFSWRGLIASHTCEGNRGLLFWREWRSGDTQSQPERRKTGRCCFKHMRHLSGRRAEGRQRQQDYLILPRQHSPGPSWFTRDNPRKLWLLLRESRVPSVSLLQQLYKIIFQY